MGEPGVPPRSNMVSPTTASRRRAVSSLQAARESGQDDDAEDQEAGADDPGEEELRERNANGDVHDSGEDVQRKLAPAGGECLA